MNRIVVDLAIINTGYRRLTSADFMRSGEGSHVWLGQ